MPGPVAHVLLVDDQDQLRRLARIVIENEIGVEVSEVSSGDAAIAACRDGEHVDVMVLDLHMPEVDGLDVLQAIIDLTDRPRVVAWSADEIARRKAMNLGADLSIDKLDVSGLTDGVRLCLQLPGKDAASPSAEAAQD